MLLTRSTLHYVHDRNRLVSYKSLETRLQNAPLPTVPRKEDTTAAALGYMRI